MLQKFKKLTGDYNKWIQEENKQKLKEFNVRLHLLDNLVMTFTRVGDVE